MLIEKALIMNIGKTLNAFALSKKMVENSLDSFNNKNPIECNRQQEFKDYSDKNFDNYGKEIVIGYIVPETTCIDGDKVLADLFIIDEYVDLWKGEYDNWCIQFNDDKSKFELVSIEVF
jgi:hypothetical protein